MVNTRYRHPVLRPRLHPLSIDSRKGEGSRPFGPALQGTAPNDLLQFDYIEIGPTTDSGKHVLMLPENHSDYKWIFPLCDTSAKNAAVAIIDWCAAFSVRQGLISDCLTRF